MMGLASALGRFVLVSVSKLGCVPKKAEDGKKEETERKRITPIKRKEN